MAAFCILYQGFTIYIKNNTVRLAPELVVKPYFSSFSANVLNVTPLFLNLCTITVHSVTTANNLETWSMLVTPFLLFSP